MIDATDREPGVTMNMGDTGKMHHLGHDAIHTSWDNALPPRLTLPPGDTCVFETREPSQGKSARDALAHHAADLDPELAALVAAAARHEPAIGPGSELRGHALTGPVYISGAEQGDTLLVEIVDIRPAEWGWTACGPGVGLLGDMFEEGTLHVWDLRSGTRAVFAPGISVPMAPFCGVMGVALAEPGRHRTTPPRRTGGNMDVRQLTAGATLALPVLVPGALFSVGDVHAAQGDGEVAGTAIEMDATVTLRFDLVKGRTISNPQFHVTTGQAEGRWFAATGHHGDLREAAREALRGVLAYLEERHDLGPAQGCLLASACVDLRISQVVNGGIYTVSAFLPLTIFDA
jgi:acetamidase/formamidase